MEDIPPNTSATDCWFTSATQRLMRTRRSVRYGQDWKLFRHCKSGFPLLLWESMSYAQAKEDRVRGPRGSRSPYKSASAFTPG